MKSTLRKVVMITGLAMMATALPAHAKGGGGGGFGIKGGIGMVGVDASGGSAGMGFGGGVGFVSGGNIGLSVDVLYMIRKTTFTGLDIKTNQIHVPVQAVFHLGPMFTLTAGGYLAYGIGNVSYSGDAVTAGVFASSSSYKDAYMKNLDYGIVAGVGVMVSRLTIEARYNMGLADLNDGSPTDSAALKQKGFDILLGFMF